MTQGTIEFDRQACQVLPNLNTTPQKVNNAGLIFVRGDANASVLFKAIGDTTTGVIGTIVAGGSLVSMNRLPIGEISLSAGTGHAVSYSWA